MAQEDVIKFSDAEAWFTRRKKEDARKDLVNLAERSLIENCFRANRSYAYGSLVEGFKLTNLSSWGADCMAADQIPGLDAPVIKNRVRQLCKVFVAKSFANDSPLPQFTTNGGDYEQTLKAELLDDAICAEYAQPHGQFRNIAQMHRHGGLIATAATGTYAVFAIDYDNCDRPEAELDDTLTLGVYKAYRYGPVRMMVRTVWMSPEEAVRKFSKKHSHAIYANIEPRAGLFLSGKGHESGSDKFMSMSRREVRVIQGWAVQVGKGKTAEVGRQMFLLKDGTELRDKEYTKPKPPWAEWHYDIELGGDWGTPLTQSVYLLNRYQNRILNDVDTAERNTSQVIIAVQKGTEGAKAMSNSQILQSKAVKLVEVDGPVESAMKVFEAPKFSKDSLALESVYDNAQFEDTGIGRNHATGTKPTGTTSGVQESLAASYYTENFAESERRSIDCRAIDTATIFVWVLQSLSEKGFERWVGDKAFRRLIKHTDLDLDEDKYVLEIKAVGEGKNTPKSQLEKAEKMLKDPSIPFTGADWVKMTETFNLDRATEQAYAIDTWVEEQVKRWQKSPLSELQKPGFYQPPERWMQIDGLRSALRIATHAFLKARQQGVPENRLVWNEKFCNECVTLIQDEETRLAKLNAPPGPPMGGPPPM
jgi:hypothetical protein